MAGGASGDGRGGGLQTQSWRGLALDRAGVEAARRLCAALSTHAAANGAASGYN